MILEDPGLPRTALVSPGPGNLVRQALLYSQFTDEKPRLREARLEGNRAKQMSGGGCNLGLAGRSKSPG